jgi:hypothetical protein
MRKFWNRIIRDSPYTLNGMLACIEYPEEFISIRISV